MKARLIEVLENKKQHITAIKFNEIKDNRLDYQVNGDQLQERFSNDLVVSLILTIHIKKSERIHGTNDLILFSTEGKKFYLKDVK